ncbi:uncharacterized protein LOC109791529 [Cajanus cajan]|uniref:uncharacterized protein LOC109791529 n=1 Tax=Cajanus cajan TaxID=3821 RepID=UPI00098DA535|nr:uncharacterized protein LOC109791529 [Cajanus cajan]
MHSGKVKPRREVRYLFVEADASYNIIIDRPTLNQLKAVVSTPHLTMKFLGHDRRIISVRANQQVARQCYANSLETTSPNEQHKNNLNALAHADHEEVTDLDPRSDARDERPSPVDELNDLQIGKLPGQTTKISRQLAPELRKQLQVEILKNADLFAWSSADMPDIDANFICHRLAIHKEAKPVTQRKRKVGGERREAVIAETQKLLHIGFIREVRYTTWLANVVLVKKNSGKWLHTSFITDHANYCYRVMPFGLKNAGATYQRLMDKVFHHQIGRNMQVYVDDMVVKTASATDHATDLAEVFAQIRKHNMRLNPEKCVFSSPQIVKQVQRLAGRLVSLSRFIPKITERAEPIFTLLKKPNNFLWTNQCEEAFQSFREFLATPPVLQRPDHNTDLLLYMAVAENAISAVIVQEHQQTQTPIYFISRVLQDAEKRYQMVEKLALALVTAARRL